MAEMLAVVASGMGVVSLAFQVADSIQRLKDFCALMKDVPEEIRLAIEEVEILSLILEDIDRDVHQELLISPAIKFAVMKSLRLCRASGNALGSLAKDMENSIVRSKKRGAFKAATKKDKMELFRKKLENAKSTFLLAHHCYSQAIQQRKWEIHEQDMAEMKKAMSHLQKISRKTAIPTYRKINASEESGSDTEEDIDMGDSAIPPKRSAYSCLPSHQVVTTQSGVKTLFGVIDLVMAKRKQGKTTSIYLGLPQWLYARRYEIQLRNSYRGWDQSFRSYKVVSFDAPVFQYSISGDVEGLRKLFAAGHASPFEVDSEGRTPLHYAAMYVRPGACRFLLAHGADANVRTSWHGSFPTSIGERNANMVQRACSRYVHDKFHDNAAYSTPLHLLALVQVRFIRGHSLHPLIRKATDEDRSIELDIQATFEALISIGQCDPFHKDQFGYTVYHLLDGSTSSWRWLRKQDEIELANLSLDEIRDLLLTRCMTSPRDDRSILYDILPKGKKLHDIAATVPYNSAFRKDTGMGSILSSIGMSLVVRAMLILTIEKRTRSPPQKIESNIILSELVSQGADLHPVFLAYGHLFTPLTFFLSMVLKVKSNGILLQRYELVVPIIRGWLKALAAAGVDLEAYGVEERAIHDRGDVSWIFELDSGRADHDIGSENTKDSTPKSYLNYQILDIHAGELPEEWHIEWEDVYVSSALAADFWNGVEGGDEGLPQMPGSWTD